MSDQVMLLVGTKKGGFIVEGQREGSPWAVRGPLCDGWPIHDLAWDPTTRIDLRGRRQPLVRAGRIPQRRPRRDVDALVRRA